MLHRKIAILSRSAIVGFAALVGAILALLGTALLTDKAAFLVSAALVVLCVANFIGYSFLLQRRLNKKTSIVQGVSALVLVGIFYVAVLMPTAGERVPDIPGVRYWELATGSRIAYLELEPEQRTHAEPIIVLHGGPGVADLQGDAAYFGRLREEGYAVYVYDQVGAGRSSRLPDPSGYTIERNAADLEEIRTQIGAEHIILIGHSYGAALAARYIAHHGDHVIKLIVSSPGALNDGVTGGGDLQSRLSTAQKLSLYALILQPRPLTVYTLLQINPRAAHQFAGDAEMDARNDNVYAATEPAVHCGNKEAAHRLHGVGFYAHQFPQSAHAVPPPDITPALRRSKIPTLVIKGACDYLTWASALDYLDAFQAGPAQLVYLRGAGHNAYQDKPHEFEMNLKAFLHGQPVPNEYIGTQVPADYEKGY